MTTEKETWLHEYARNKRLADAEKAPKPGFSSKFTSDGDARMPVSRPANGFRQFVRRFAQAARSEESEYRAVFGR